MEIRADVSDNTMWESEYHHDDGYKQAVMGEHSLFLCEDKEGASVIRKGFRTVHTISLEQIPLMRYNKYVENNTIRKMCCSDFLFHLVQ